LELNLLVLWKQEEQFGWRMEKSCCNLHNLSCFFCGVALIDLQHTVCGFGEQNYTDHNGSHHSECQHSMDTVCNLSCAYSL
jgi:hypothetical protein